MEKNNYLKSGAWYMIGNLLIKGVTFFTLPIFTRLLSTADFGKFNLFVSYENILNVILGLGVAGTIKTAYFDFKEDFKKYYGAILSLIFIFTISIDIVINIALIFSGQNLNKFWDYDTVNLLVGASLATALYNVISMKYVIEVDYKKNLIMSFGYTISSVLISVGLCFTIFASSRYMARIVGNALPLILITYLISLKQIFNGNIYINKTYYRYALVMGIPLIFHSLSLVIMQQADKIMVNSFCGDEMTGVYSLACNISLILTVVQSSIDNSWSPWFYLNLDSRNYGVLCKKNRLIIWLFLYLTVGFMLISPELVFITSPSDYAEAIYALIPLNLSVFVSFMYMFAVNKEYYYKKTRIIAVGTIVSTIIDILLNTIMIPKFGFISAAYTTLISKMILFVIHWIVSNKIDENQIVMAEDLLLSFAVSVLFAVITLIFKDVLLLRYGLIVLITVVAILVMKKNNVSIKDIRR